MRFATSISALALATVALAQDSPITIHVGSLNGKQALAFDPPSVTAKNGTVVTFVFDGMPGNHTVAQSSFQNPCEPVQGGFDSGYIFVPNNTDFTGPFPTFNLTIDNDSKPIWFYCAQTKPVPHCLNAMVGSINAPASGNTFSSFSEVAKVQSSVAPPVPALSGVGAFATAAPGPLTGSITGFAVPSGTAPAGSNSGSAGSGTGSGSGAAPTNTKNSAGTVQLSGFVAFLAAAFGVVLV
ncbi:hypothetical protein BV20DRAFT_464708 [Pilatotrama ljubarskyi]|nr:hypothetical protein BV20DRAFT_464708 [Pilatotrama ljubarskyi]